MNNNSYSRDTNNSYLFQRSGVIVNHSELLQHIEDLKAEKKNQETELKSTFTDLSSTLNLVSLFKGTPIKQELPLDLVKMGVNKVVDLIIDLALGRHKSFKGFLSSVLVEKFTSTLIDNNLITIISGISSLLHQRRKTKTNIE